MAHESLVTPFTTNEVGPIRLILNISDIDKTQRVRALATFNPGARTISLRHFTTLADIAELDIERGEAIIAQARADGTLASNLRLTTGRAGHYAILFSTLDEIIAYFRT